MKPFDIGNFHRLADQLEKTAINIKEHVNSPEELKRHIAEIEEIKNSLQSYLTQKF